MPKTLISVTTVLLLSALTTTVFGDDQRIARQIQSGLKSQQDTGLLKHFDLRVRVEDGVVWMKGFVASPSQRNRAVNLARRIRGVNQVVNEIDLANNPSTSPTNANNSVDAPAPTDLTTSVQVNDDQIARQIENKLKNQQDSGALKHFDLRVNVLNGVVWMKGFVANPDQQSLAVDLATQVHGVKQVVNQIEISHQLSVTSENPNVPTTPSGETPPLGRNDEKIAQQIENKLKANQKNGLLKHFDLRARVKDGIVWMNGFVASPEHRNVAVDTANQVQGVNKVVNEIELSGDLVTNPKNPTIPVAAAIPDKSVKTTRIKTSDSDLASFPRQAADTKTPPAEEKNPQQPVAATAPPVAPASQTATATLPAVTTTLPAVTTTPPAVTATLPAVTTTPPAVTATPPAATATPPAVTATPPAATAALPAATAALPTARVAPPVGIAAKTIEKPRVTTTRQSTPITQAARQQTPPVRLAAAQQAPVAFAPARTLLARHSARKASFIRNEGRPIAANMPGVGAPAVPARFDHANLPNYAWPSYASYPNYAALAYPQQYSATAWPYIGPFYPYPQVPMGWRKVTLEWDDGWWYLDYQSK